MPSDIIFKKNKNGGGLFNFKLPFINKSEQNKSLKSSIESSKTYGSASSSSILIGAQKSAHLDKKRKLSLKK